MTNIRNSVLLIGNLGKDPEMRTLQNGQTVTRMTLATNEYYRNQNGDRVTSTEWHNLVAWGKTAQLMKELLQKGKPVAVRGKLTHRSYQDKDGKTRYTSEIVVREFTLLGKPQEQGA